MTAPTWSLLVTFLCSCLAQPLLDGSTKVVTGGIGSAGKWVESGNRLPDNWSPLPVGSCQWETSTPARIQAVGYGGDGTTCSFQAYESAMPAVHQDGYLIAASTDLYQGFHFPDDWHLTPRTPQWGPCNYDSGARFNESHPRLMCGQGCGECYLITGPAGSQTFIVNEVSDILAVGISSQGVNFNLGNGAGRGGVTAPCRGSDGALQPGECNLKVMTYQGPTAISVKKVPCPIEGQIRLGVHGYNSNPLDGSNLEIVVLHHRLGITSLWVQGRNATEHPSGWKWVPRGWTNTFNFYPGNGLSGHLYDLSPSKTFDIKLRSVLGTDLLCTATWSPTALSSDSTRGIVSLGSCQFPSVAVDNVPCDPPMPPNPFIAEQAYSYSCSGLDCTDCPELNKTVAGCSIKTEGEFLLEWRDWGSYGLPGKPNWGFTGDCHSGTKCIDSTLSTGWAGIMLGWTQPLVPSHYSRITEVRYWAKCVSASCSVNFGVYNPCATSSAGSVAYSSSWAEYTVNMTRLMEACPEGFNVVRWDFGPNVQFYLDDAAFYCGGELCKQPTQSSTPTVNPPSSTPTVNPPSSTPPTPSQSPSSSSSLSPIQWILLFLLSFLL
eukprot:TRINITY_DN10193_c0_g1_i1.p1 TRINITY_DN10193_c0_g1~~TRINITY_DN10193_c0_g1_i1.p1  ORF type:complete len:604 (+),score=87.91 TRINITY_DN10193_c0_g1_i1:24-1835(+)